jgi:hypothetical protein
MPVTLGPVDRLVAGRVRLVTASGPADSETTLHIVIFVTSTLDRELLRIACESGGIPHQIAGDADDFAAKLRETANSVGFMHIQDFETLIKIKADPTFHEKPLFVVNSYGSNSPYPFDGSLNAVHELPYPFVMARVLDRLEPYL